ncbi:MAG: TolC family protein [Bacteroidaceae bacterium]|nr:TolC family protein [Bacteroidaceae bacterium]
MRKRFLRTAVLALAALTVFETGSRAQIVLTMEQALEYSAQHNPDLINSRLSMEQYEQNLIAQKASLKSRFSLNLQPLTYSQSRQFDSRYSDWYTNRSLSSSGTFSISQPIIWTDATLSLNNSLSWQNNESSIAGKTNSNRAFSNSLYLSLTQPIFTYNRTKMNLRQIEMNYENARISYALQLLNVERNITSQFYNLFVAQQNLAISESELENAEKNFNIIKDKVEADLVTKDEYYQAELNLAQSRSSLENQRVSLENSKDNFKQTLGIPLDEDIMVVCDIEAEPVIVDFNKALESATTTRLELRQRQISRENQEMTMIQVKDNDSFSGNISLSLGVMGDDTDFNHLYDNPTNNPRVSISFSVPIFDWGARKARIKAQEIGRKMFELSADEELKSIEMNVRSTCRSLDNLVEQISIAEQSQRNAQLTYDLNEERYRNGELTGMQMNQFQTQLSNSKMSYTQAIINYKVQLLNLKILTLYDFEKNEPVTPITYEQNKDKKKK